MKILKNFLLLLANTRLKALKIAHKELLSRLNVNNLLESHFMLEDVPKLLDHISQEVIFAVKLRDNLERIKLLNMCDLEEERYEKNKIIII